MELAVVDSFSCRTRGLRKHMVKIVEHWGLSCLTKKHLGGDRRLVTASGDRMWPGGIEDRNAGLTRGLGNSEQVCHDERGCYRQIARAAVLWEIVPHKPS